MQGRCEAEHAAFAGTRVSIRWCAAPGMSVGRRRRDWLRVFQQSRWMIALPFMAKESDAATVKAIVPTATA
jgi:hypothetical protein